MSRTRRPSYYLAYTTPRDPMQRVALSRELLRLGCLRLHHSFWRVPRESGREALRAARRFEPLLFKRTRELIRGRVNEQKGLYEVGSLTLIAYRADSSRSDLRSRIYRMAHGSVSLRISKSMYLFPQLKSSRYATLRGRVITPDEFYQRLVSSGVEVHRLTSLRLVYPQSHLGVLDRFAQTKIRDCQTLIDSAHSLRSDLGSLSISSTQLSKRLSNLKMRFSRLRRVSYLLYRLYGIDLRSHLRKTYAAIAAARNFHGAVVRK